MIIPGRHAKVQLYETQLRVFKTYKHSNYVDNELFVLKFLAEMDIMNLNPRKESLYTISMDWIKETIIPDLSNCEQRKNLISNLVVYLQNLHGQSYQKYGKYITHEDIFTDNLLLCKKEGILYFIDWGLSKKRNTVLPDFASAAMGIFNEYPESFKSFVIEYFGNLYNLDVKVLEEFILELYEEYKNIRLDNNFEIDTLNKRLDNAKSIIKLL